MMELKQDTRDKVAEQILGRFRGQRVLVLGIGGGGDVISGLPTCFDLERIGAEVLPGGLTWKRAQHDPESRPRRMNEFQGMALVNDLIGFVNPKTVLRDGIQHVEAQLSAVMDSRPIVAVDITPGSAALADALEDFMRRERVSGIVGIDAGGDALCMGTESSIRSPICDQTVIAALARINGALLGVHSFRTDGELAFAEFKPRFETLAAQRAYHGALDVSPHDHDRMSQILTSAKTESSRFSVQVSSQMNDADRARIRASLNDSAPGLDEAASGLTTFPLRGGSRVGELSPLTAFTLFFDPGAVFRSSTFAGWWEGTADVRRIHQLFEERGVMTEFTDLEKKSAVL